MKKESPTLKIEGRGVEVSETLFFKKCSFRGEITVCRRIIYVNKKEIIHNIITPGMIIFGILTIVMFVFERRRMLVEWDEFSHWGSVVKSMFLTK